MAERKEQSAVPNSGDDNIYLMLILIVGVVVFGVLFYAVPIIGTGIVGVSTNTEKTFE